MPRYTETDFEDHIEGYLNQSGYRSLQPTDYDKSLCLIPNETLQFIQDTQPEEYQKLERQHGEDTPQKLTLRISNQIKSRGVLDVLRKGIKDRGCSFDLTYFQPSSGMNPTHKKLYNQNRFSLIRQLHYSQRNEKSLDMVVPQRSAVSDNGTEEQPHRSDCDGCRETVPHRPGSERAVVPIQAMSGSLRRGQREGFDDNPIAGWQDTLLSV